MGHRGHEDEHSLKHSLKPAIWRFPRSHGPLNHPFLFGTFHEINQLAIGIPTIYGNPHIGIPSIFSLTPIHWIRGWTLTKAQRQDLRPAIAGCHAAGCQRETLIMIEVGPCQQWSNGELTWNICETYVKHKCRLDVARLGASKAPMHFLPSGAQTEPKVAVIDLKPTVFRRFDSCRTGARGLKK